MRIAVTGGTGFLGGHIVRRLLDDDHAVRVLARDPRRADALRGRVEEIVVGDIADRAPLDALMAGTDAVIHLVSNFRTTTDTTAQTTRTNLEGTIQALEAAQRASVKRFVHCSTIGVHGDVRTTPADESSPYNPGDDYQTTKKKAEDACRAQMARGDMEIVMVRPCSIYGPGDLRMLKMFRMLKKGRFVMLGPCRENFHAVFIDDLVDGFMRALTTDGIAGEVFIVGGPSYVPLVEYVETAAAAAGAPPPGIKLPYWPAYALSAMCEALCRPLRIPPPLHRRRVKFFKNNRAFAIEKARRVLGYAPKVELAEGMRRTVAWYQEHGHL